MRKLFILLALLLGITGCSSNIVKKTPRQWLIDEVLDNYTYSTDDFYVIRFTDDLTFQYGTQQTGALIEQHGVITEVYYPAIIEIWDETGRHDTYYVDMYYHYFYLVEPYLISEKNVVSVDADIIS